jgi:hypothetical protein
MSLRLSMIFGQFSRMRISNSALTERLSALAASAASAFTWGATLMFMTTFMVAGTPHVTAVWSVCGWNIHGKHSEVKWASAEKCAKTNSYGCCVIGLGKV